MFKTTRLATSYPEHVLPFWAACPGSDTMRRPRGGSATGAVMARAEGCASFVHLHRTHAAEHPASRPPPSGGPSTRDAEPGNAHGVADGTGHQGQSDMKDPSPISTIITL